MKARSKKGGYNAATAAEYLSLEAPLCSLSTELEPRYEYVDGKSTGNIIAYSAWFVQEGNDPFKVKFENKIKLPEFLSTVTLEDLEAVVVNYTVYFRANNMMQIS
ncbi:hypothetical protein [Streptococcus acidominimus]|uniref:SuB0782 undefined product 764400:764714 forward MW:11955 n=1 Tax=Streptococcus acidominimus TaxID=1326 RepID=A0A1Q8E721_STRAI|nr:hypothetical protein [Streptococcus acidominimus]OLF47583.1 hypothetical protein BU200_10145 [Streptococcus acidominimus]SUN08595.1 Uncharacterised protein [Streptococcus acidominimus]